MNQALACAGIGTCAIAVKSNATGAAIIVPMTETTTADLLTNTVTTNLDAPVDGSMLAEQANYSRFHFQRLFREQTGETPGDCRRRLLLERAGYQLRQTPLSVTEIAFEAFGGMIAHVLTFAAYRRTVALQVLARLSVTDLGYGDPIEWEMQLTPNQPTSH